MSTQYIFTTYKLSRRYPPDREVLSDISLSFLPGAKIGVLGLNGSGKSSLLRIMAGEDREFEGEAVPMPNMRIGYLPQEPQLAADKSVRETVEEGMGEVLAAKARLDEIYAAYADPDADADPDANTSDLDVDHAWLCRAEPRPSSAGNCADYDCLD